MSSPAVLCSPAYWPRQVSHGRLKIPTSQNSEIRRASRSFHRGPACDASSPPAIAPLVPGDSVVAAGRRVGDMWWGRRWGDGAGSSSNSGGRRYDDPSGCQSGGRGQDSRSHSAIGTGDRRRWPAARWNRSYFFDQGGCRNCNRGIDDDQQPGYCDCGVMGPRPTRGHAVPHIYNLGCSRR